MNSKMSHLLFCFLFVLCSRADAFNITQFLNQYPDFSTFNNYLTQTLLASDINSRRTITVLVVDNNGLSPLSGRTTNFIKAVMSVHVILDYYDEQKLMNLANKSTIVTTLFQASGRAVGQQGFLNITDLSTGSVSIASAVPGSSFGANLVKSIAAQPYNVSVLQVSTVIIPVGIDSSSNSSSNSTAPPPPPPPSSPKAPTPAPSPKSPKSPPTPAPSPDDVTPPTKSPPSPSPKSSPPKPSKAPASAPSPSLLPEEPTADAPAADVPPTAAGSTTLRQSLGAISMVASAALALVAMVW